MNLILLLPGDFSDNHIVTLTDERRVKHILGIQKPKVGDQLSVGLLNGKMGKATITHMSSNTISLEPVLDIEPPAALNISLILGLPRPQMLKRTLQNIGSLGIKECVLMHSNRVEKSYWQSPLLAAEKIRQELILGLEQGCDTVLPTITFAKRFKPFIEDTLCHEVSSSTALVAHPYVPQTCPKEIKGNIHLAVGPEGGFIDHEVELLSSIGFQGVTLGSRILKVETVIPYLAGLLAR